MRAAGSISAAALAVGNPPPAPVLADHCDETEFADHVARQPICAEYKHAQLQVYRRFRRCWPDLHSWLARPLPERVGRLGGERRGAASFRLSYQARPYLYFLALTDRLRLDYPWLLAVGNTRPLVVAAQLDMDLGIPRLIEEGVALGYNRAAIRQAISWSVARIAMHEGVRDPDRLRAEHVDRLLAAIRDFAEHRSIELFFDSAEAYRRGRAKSWITHGGQLAVILYHRGQTERQPAKTMPPWAVRPPVQPEMRALVDRWLDISRPVLRPNTLYHREISLRRLLEYLATAAPEVRSFAQVTRDHVLGFLAAMAEDIQPTTGRRLATHTRCGRTSDVALFFRDLVVLGWEGPGQLLIDSRDKPRVVDRVPRFIPQAELDRIMAAIRALPCPYQRAALLTLRWSGARRGEVRRLSFDCLDCYPDGTHRLRLPAGKTYKERTVPLHDEAAEALRGVMALRADTPDRWFTDELTGGRVRHLFVVRGKLISAYYLFETALQQACRNAGLVDASGHGTISAHRFRHTLGTQLAERGARLDTIMSVLGHQSPGMSMVYARISDPEVLRDYQAVLGPGALIAGPGAEAVRSGTLSAGAIDWLKANFLKTELELGHCLRLPEEGPCECDLYLACPRFVTTPAYASRLRERHDVELRLADDARSRDWPREVERHCAVAARIERLLADMGENPPGG
ncbi:tyrosine-type recombinase/integrase [Microvirga sp. Mcv34]|uniref:tyrosine-type recombinase/integrase n=1 Tax=Microvirga sp. Mcv34 TaxID=2926016 RepID=UPI0021CA0960|nr:site-specific integrase [Microvirga sp. Mcv34]